RVLHDQPARRKNYEIGGCRSGRIRLRCQYGKNRRVRMIVTEGAENVETRQDRFAWRQVAVPGNHIERRVTDTAMKQPAAKFRQQLEISFPVLISGDRRCEIATVCKAVTADRPAFRQLELASVIFADVAASDVLL